MGNPSMFPVDVSDEIKTGQLSRLPCQFHIFPLISALYLTIKGCVKAKLSYLLYSSKFFKELI